MNLFTFTGNLGKPCERKVTQGGLAVCEFSVAVTSGYGEKAKTTWVKCSLFGKKAEGKLPEYLNAGTKVAVSGELTLDQWEKDGVKNSMLKVNVNTLDLLSSPPLANNAPADQNMPSSSSQAPAGGFDDFNQDIPF